MRFETCHCRLLRRLCNAAVCLISVEEELLLKPFAHLSRFRRRLLALWVALLLASAWPTAPLAAQESRPLYQFEECETIEEAALRDELNTLAQSIFVSGQDELDVAAVVDRQWIALDVDSTIEGAVSAAVDRVYADESYWSRFLSGWSADKAQEFTTQIANDAFGSEAFRAKIDVLSSSVADEISQQMTAISARSASSALLCVQSFIGNSYSDTMAGLFEAELQQQMESVDLANVDASVNPLLGAHTKSLAGIGVIIGAQIAKKLAQKLAQRIAGRVVGRILGKAATSIIPIAGWIIGGGLIVWDLIEGGNGALPQIQEALQEESIKAGIRSEITLTIDEELRKELPEVARAVSTDIYSAWSEFKAKYTQVIALAGENETFRALVDETDPAEVSKLTTVVVTSEQVLGADGLQRAIADGTLEQIFRLPQEALEILRTTSSINLVLAWADLAGASLGAVVASELYKVVDPERVY